MKKFAIPTGLAALAVLVQVACAQNKSVGPIAVNPAGKGTPVQKAAQNCQNGIRAEGKKSLSEDEKHKDNKDAKLSGVRVVEDKDLKDSQGGKLVLTKVEQYIAVEDTSKKDGPAAVAYIKGDAKLDPATNQLTIVGSIECKGLENYKDGSLALPAPEQAAIISRQDGLTDLTFLTLVNLANGKDSKDKDSVTFEFKNKRSADPQTTAAATGLPQSNEVQDNGILKDAAIRSRVDNGEIEGRGGRKKRIMYLLNDHTLEVLTLVPVQARGARLITTTMTRALYDLQPETAAPSVPAPSTEAPSTGSR